MKSLHDYLTELGWDTAELARQAGINYATAAKAVDGDTISSRTARDIAKALSEATGSQVNVGSIRGLVIGR